MKQTLNPGNHRYSPPEATEIVIQMEERLLVFSVQNTSLAGAGVNESEADDNGSSIW
jgi:hypothetical protein